MYELTWEYFLVKMAELEAQKRDNIPETTQEVWYRTFKNRNWDKTKFDIQFQKVLSKPSYGAVKIDEFFVEDQAYTMPEVERMIELRINSLTCQGERLLTDKEMNLQEYLNLKDDYIKLAVAKKLKFQQYNEQQEAYELIIDRSIEIAKSELER
ncbi:MAG: hypothetical protein A2W11_03755 [Ignavibacteria bacterium RBG_16_35_7]|nr:MAG: hypothetical protein A2W11_03755 [Ignavibacteria bacterium RBG_16_35_7]